MKHKFTPTNNLTAGGKVVFECSSCGKKTVDNKDKTPCKSTHYSAMVAAARTRYKKSNFQFFNQKYEKPNDDFRFPYKG